MTEYMLQHHAVLCFIPEADGSLADNAGEGGACVCYVINTIYCENGACTFRIQGRSGGQGLSPTYEQAHVGLDLLPLASLS